MLCYFLRKCVVNKFDYDLINIHACKPLIFQALRPQLSYNCKYMYSLGLTYQHNFRHNRNAKPLSIMLA